MEEEDRVYEAKLATEQQADRGRHGNVDQVDDSGRRIKRLCVHPVEGVPDADTMLAQKLFLEGSEEELLRVANHN